MCPAAIEPSPEAAVAPSVGATSVGVRCRAMGDADLSEAARLLTRGFPDRTLDYWSKGLERLRTRALPEEFDRFGHVLEDEGRLVGIHLTLYAPARRGGLARCNVSSWYVEPDYRHMAVALSRKAGRRKDVLYLNISPADHTRALIAAQGFVSYNENTVLAAAWLSAPRPGARVRTYDPSRHDPWIADPYETRLAGDHRDMGCIVLCVETSDGVLPFVFQRKPLPGLPRGCVHIIYTPSMADLARFAGALGRALLRQGVWIWKLDGDAPPSGMVGLSFKGRSARCVRGGDPPGLNDLSYTELVIFGP